MVPNKFKLGLQKNPNHNAIIEALKQVFPKCSKGGLAAPSSRKNKMHSAIMWCANLVLN